MLPAELLLLLWMESFQLQTIKRYCRFHTRSGLKSAKMYLCIVLNDADSVIAFLSYIECKYVNHGINAKVICCV